MDRTSVHTKAATCAIMTQHFAQKCSDAACAVMSEHLAECCAAPPNLVYRY